ncbi:hypothetical protein BBBOND_0103980 [Babesia bigemina]|uniref:Uncharacterized protein n=1 Tax=Babesia bigemina TaxID=5866 RepID=A0A061D093_BABBI|nr:hypothetical protein BBBOND_0103980 [Babesia bigemina]CDR94088.1 hypothetical protein BBBOND_0103980 [Babesia bigemina]|eukprot:XP_012766274.1 hypothetical protein BBBOND_0103980 [Babesia bigemina]
MRQWLGWVLSWAFLYSECSARAAGRRAFLAPALWSPYPVLPKTSTAWGSSARDQDSTVSSGWKGSRRGLTTLCARMKHEEPFAGSDSLLDKRSMFSNTALELTLEDMAAREADFERYKNSSLSHFRNIGAVVASVLTVGALYGALSMLRGMLNQQHANLRADRYGSLTPHSDVHTGDGGHM